MDTMIQMSMMEKIRMIKTYSELIKIPTFEERYEYLKLNGKVSELTFGHNRYLNQDFYRSKDWQDFRRKIIIRDDGCDLAHPDHKLYCHLVIHHLNPITVEDIVNKRRCVFDPENAVCTMHKTHNAIHYGDISQINSILVERAPNDTCPWR